MSGPAVTVVPQGGTPVTAVEQYGVPMTVVEAGGVPVTLTPNGPPVVLVGHVPPSPPAPGPLDKMFDEDGLSDLTVEYDLAAEIAVLGVVTRFDGTLTGFTATHGGETLDPIRVDINAAQNIATALFIGNGLTIEPADVVVTPVGGATLGPAVMRINDNYAYGEIGSHWNAGNTGTNWGPTPTQTMTGVGGINSAIYAGGSIITTNDLTPIPPSEYEKLAWMLAFAGTWQDDMDWALDGVDVVGGEYVHTAAIVGTMTYTLPAPTSKQFAFEIDVLIPEQSPRGQLFVRMFSGATTMQRTLNGPYDGKWKVVSGSNNYTTDKIQIVLDRDVTIRSIRIIEEPKVVSGVFGHSNADVIDGDTYALQIPTAGGWATSVAEVYDVSTPWRSGLFVAGNNVFGWGFASAPLVSAQLGQLVNGPYAEGRLISFWEAPDDSRVIVCFSGDVAADLTGHTFDINGTILGVIEGPTYSPENNWTMMFLEPFWMTSGSAYVITRVEQ